MLKSYNIKNLKQLFRTNLAEIYEQSEIDSIYSLVIEHVLAYNRTTQLLNSEKTVLPDKEAKIIDILEQLKNKRPIQYILESTEFFGIQFRVNNNVLIPRQETELLVDKIIKENTSKNISILDIGTGSGCIAISLKKHLKNATLTAIDISEEALKTAKINAELNNAEITFLKADILDETLALNKYDLIVSNPPYVKEDEKEKMHKNVLDYEPHLALFVPNSSALKYYKAINNFAKNHLTETGVIWVEINEALGNETAKVFKTGGFSNTQIFKDLNGKARIIYATRL